MEYILSPERTFNKDSREKGTWGSGTKASSYKLSVTYFEKKWETESFGRFQALRNDKILKVTRSKRLLKFLFVFTHNSNWR